MDLPLYQRLFGAPFRLTEPEFAQRVADAREQHDVEAQCRALLDLAFAHIHMGSAASAKTHVSMVLQMAHSSGLVALEMEALLWRDASIHFSNDHVTTTSFSDTARLLGEHGLQHFLPIALILRAREANRTERRDSVDIQIELALHALETVTDPYVRAFVFRLSGMLYREHEQFTEAITLFERARSVAEHEQLFSQLARTLGAIGATYIADQRPKEGLTELLHALELYDKLEIHDWYVAETNLNIAVLHRIGNDPSDGIEYAARSIALFREIGDVGEASHAENILGVLYERTGDLDAALAAYLHADAQFATLQTRHKSSSLPLANAAHILITRKLYADALPMLHRAMDKATAIDSAVGQSQAYAFLGAFYDVEESPLYDPRKAEEYLLRGHEIDVRRGSPSSILLEFLAAYYEHHEQYEDALRYTKELFAFRERVHDETAQRRILHVETRRRIEEAQTLAEIEQLRNVELKAAQTLLVQSEKMASLGQLTAGIAHEINNPVTFITSSIAPLRRDLEQYDALKGQGPEALELRTEILDLLNAIETGARRTSEIVRSLRTFSRLDESSVKSTDIITGIESTLTLLGTRIKGQVEIIRAFDGVQLVDCRPSEINQVIMNILSNAIDALENTPHPTISISVRSADTGHMEILIEDNGPGIPDSAIQRLFEPFFTTKDVGRGTGLGLSISYGIIERHHGSISVSNTPGARFCVLLPLKQTT